LLLAEMVVDRRTRAVDNAGATHAPLRSPRYPTTIAQF
jgi:hypothetical protein